MVLTNILKNKTPTSAGACLSVTETNKPVTYYYPITVIIAGLHVDPDIFVTSIELLPVVVYV